MTVSQPHIENETQSSVNEATPVDRLSTVQGSNLLYRLDLLSLCEKDEEMRKDVLALCKDDILFWVNNFCWTKDPRKKPDSIPFVLYDQYQAQYIKDVEDAIV